jgi:nucleoside-diphosphate-sugar epimerase
LDKSLLITGATGGLGIALVKEARRRGISVKATGRSLKHRAQIEAQGASFVQADLLDFSLLPALLEGQGGIIHAAALSSSWGPYEEFYLANVVATRHLLKAAQDQKIERFIYISSPSIFATFADRLSIKDQDSPRKPPLNHYAQTKLIAEQMVLAAAKPGLATVAIRPRALVGPHDRVLLPKLIALAKKKAMPLPRGGKALIELTDVRDAASAILSAYERAEQISGQAFNISGGTAFQVRDIAVKLAEAIGASPRLIHLPLALAAPLATLMEAWARLSKSRNEPVLTRYTLATLAFSQTFDLTNAQQALDWKPSHLALETLLLEASRTRE